MKNPCLQRVAPPRVTDDASGEEMAVQGAGSEPPSALTETPVSGATKEKVSPLRPRLSFEAITFSDGSTLAVDDDDIVVFVGPNNAGKSATLRELEAWIARSNSGIVVNRTTLRKVVSIDDLRKYLDENSQNG